MKEVESTNNPRNSNFCTMDENHQKTWIVLTEDEKAELEMVLFEMTLYDLGLRWKSNEILFIRLIKLETSTIDYLLLLVSCFTSVFFTFLDQWLETKKWRVLFQYTKWSDNKVQL